MTRNFLPSFSGDGSLARVTINATECNSQAYLPPDESDPCPSNQIIVDPAMPKDLLCADPAASSGPNKA